MHRTTLAAFIGQYRATSTDVLSDAYVEQLVVAVRLLDKYAGHAVTLGELSDSLANGFVDHLATDRAPATVRGRRNSILALWREAFRQGIIDVQPQRIRRIRVGHRVPQAWDWDEVAQLLATVQREKKLLRNGIGRGIYFASLVSAAWDTALRLGDLLELTTDDIAHGRPFPVQQHKTGDAVAVSFSCGTSELVRECLDDGPPRSLVWPLWGRREAFFVMFRKMVAKAGIRRGTFKWLRRGAITDVEASGMDGSRLAGHRSRSVTERHYIDVSHLRPPSPRPLLA